MISRNLLRAVTPALFLSACFATQASAVVVWADDFSGETDGAAPNQSFPGGAAGNDWNRVNNNTAGATTLISGAVGSGDTTSMRQLDTLTTETGNAAVTRVARNQWSSAANLSSTTNVLRISFDMRVDSFGASTDNGPRFILRDEAAADKSLSIGFGRGTAGDVNGQLAFYAQTASSGSSFANPTDANRIGDFNLGAYDSTTPGNNQTGGFFRVEFTYDYNTGKVVGTVTDLTNHTTATFDASMLAGLDFSNPATNADGSPSNNDGLLFASGSTSTSDVYWDNISVEIIPEPSVALLAAGGVGALCLRRRRA